MANSTSRLRTTFNFPAFENVPQKLAYNIDPDIIHKGKFCSYRKEKREIDFPVYNVTNSVLCHSMFFSLKKEGNIYNSKKHL